MQVQKLCWLVVERTLPHTVILTVLLLLPTVNTDSLQLPAHQAINYSLGRRYKSEFVLS
jgi:hypothetical protein